MEKESKTPIGKDYAKTTEFINKMVEPTIHKIVEEANKHLKKLKIRIGAEIKWLIERTEDDDKKDSGR